MFIFFFCLLPTEHRQICSDVFISQEFYLRIFAICKQYTGPHHWISDGTDGCLLRIRLALRAVIKIGIVFTWGKQSDTSVLVVKAVKTDQARADTAQANWGLGILNQVRNNLSKFGDELLCSCRLNRLLVCKPHGARPFSPSA